MEKQWFVYIVECADGTYYTGITDDIPRRLDAHNRGKGAKYTRGRGPVRLRYSEIAESYGAALSRERAIKALTRQQKQSLFPAE